MDISKDIEEILSEFDRERRVFKLAPRIEFLRDNPSMPISLYMKVRELGCVIFEQACEAASPRKLVVIQTKESYERDYGKTESELLF